jgi:hypothetical protein
MDPTEESGQLFALLMMFRTCCLIFYLVYKKRNTQPAQEGKLINNLQSNSAHFLIFDSLNSSETAKERQSSFGCHVRKSLFW